MATPRPTSPTAAAQLVARRADALRLEHPVRVVIDGSPWSGLDLAPLVATELVALSRPAVVVRAADFLRPASLRLERGRDDPDAFYESWLDLAALRREVFDPCAPGGSARVLPSLWDVEADRATRAGYVTMTPRTVLVVTGWFLLGAGLDADLTVHVALSPAARGRSVPAASSARELPAFDRYDAEVDPVSCADIVIRADDPRHPAVVDRSDDARRD